MLAGYRATLLHQDGGSLLFQLPAGDEQNDFKLALFISVADRYGAFTSGRVTEVVSWETSMEYLFCVFSYMIICLVCA